MNLREYLACRQTAADSIADQDKHAVPPGIGRSYQVLLRVSLCPLGQFFGRQQESAEKLGRLLVGMPVALDQTVQFLADSCRFVRTAG